MGLWRFILLFALVVGSVLPHQATATPAPAPAAHHVGMAHDRQQPTHHAPQAHHGDACIGCATPVRLALAAPVAPMPAANLYVVLHETLTTGFTALDPPPPRSKA